ncbi:MAG: metalloregulator ArsR/SmtB family transcription factor [Methylocystis sp.]
MDMEQLAPKAAEAESFLKAMASRHRLMILCELHESELSVSALQGALGLGQSSLSQHLARLRADGLVETRRVSQTIFYRIDNPKVSRMMQALYECFCADGENPASAKNPQRGEARSRRP